MHKGAAAMHCQRPLADSRASLQRGTHPKEARRLTLHQFRTLPHIASPARNRATACHSPDSGRIGYMACRLQYTSGTLCRTRPAG